MSEEQKIADGSLEKAAPPGDAPLAGELAALRLMRERDGQEIAALRQALQSRSDDAGRAQWQLVETRRRLEQAQTKAAELENSTSYRLGQMIASAIRSPVQLASLPLRIVGLLRRPHAAKVSERTIPSAPIPATPVLPRKPEAHASEVTEGTSFDRQAFGQAAPPELPSTLSALRVAAIMDDFTRACFAPVCKLTTLRADTYESQLIEARPHLLLVESAWRGEGDSWRHMVAQRSGELLGLLDMCRRRGIPTVFWNKEDPAHFQTFLPTAKLFDHVFTTDIDSVRRYVDALGHSRVHLLPFACQPLLHHPLTVGPRKDGFAFAGSYYHRYPERCQDFERLVGTLQRHGEVVIFDRNSGRGDPAFAFPRRYAPMLRPALPYERIDEAYKGYRFAININTVKQSQTMFARRAFELMASNTLLVSNYSRGMRNLFGDLVVATDDVVQLEHRIDILAGSSQEARRRRLLALRKVLGEHTYHHRLQTIVASVLQRSLPVRTPAVVMVGAVSSRAELDSLLASFDRQRYASRKLVVVVAQGSDVGVITVRNGIAAMGASEAATTLLASVWPGHYVARVDAADYYGPHYLSDLMSARWFAEGCAAGKSSYYEIEGGRLRLNEGVRYRRDAELDLRACVVPAAALVDASVADLLSADDLRSLAPTARTVALDEFSYCRNGAGQDAGAVDVADLPDMGISLPDLMAWAESLAGLPRRNTPWRSSATDEVNDRPADYAAWPARHATLFVAPDLASLDALAGSLPGDRLLLSAQPGRSFGEHGLWQVMSGDADDLSDLLGTGYEQVIVRAPDARCCEVLRQASARVNVFVAADETDLRGDRDPTPGRTLLAEGRPRIRRWPPGEGAAPVVAADDPASVGTTTFSPSP